ncbi:hypothetical protein PF005_g20234 [Phytophthora fragariae]|uniref:Uncharacterized protein n=1 Tax=Phytophthora fragariae TaxID=53985 RepID=A0A6A3E9Q5_9STRA|nr:hypothetical protein PF003_g39480 [Phytophthora fragariae]KAE8928621.1 hypothetical protein PF009_g21245 [Phytophthora fragariae]KAE8988495.1 hypothetical protein PF011_g19151 [Phytophthora fragariae]KAE9087693.1 hypothetical protein PF007_g20275 [Phytophthora fragariae]KAE9115765.1 hypothetical protein PF006_g19207 [Phytophthora fragariae]
MWGSSQHAEVNVQHRDSTQLDSLQPQDRQHLDLTRSNSTNA